MNKIKGSAAGRLMLKWGGIINIVIGLLHIGALFFLGPVLRYCGVDEKMAGHAAVWSASPWVITTVVAVIFIMFGFYGLSAATGRPRLPFVKTGVNCIAAIYCARGIIGLAYVLLGSETNLRQLAFSVIALVIGLMFLNGGIKLWGWFGARQSG